jgi:hypothetical protein
MSKNSKKTNYGKWSFIIGTPIAFASAIAAVIAVPDIGCKVGWNLSACTVARQEIDLITQAETGESLAGVKIQFIAKGAPEIQYTDNNGYAKVQIPSKGDVRVNLSKSGYPVQDFTVNLENDQSTVRIVRFSQSGQPNVQPVVSLPQQTTSPSPQITIEPTSSSQPSPDANLASVLLQTDCQSATPGKNLNYILSKHDNVSVTLGREVIPLFAIVGNLNAEIDSRTPIEFVCNLKSSYKELKLVFGVHSGNSYALPNNKLMFTAFLDGKQAGTKQVVVGSKQEWILNLQGVKNVALRTECTVKTCPALYFTEMTLK